MYVAQVSGGTVTKITEADSDKGGGEFGGRIDMGSADTYTGRFPNANIYQIDASGNEANYGVTVKKMEDSVQAAASGDVVAVNLGATSALSGSFFRAAADENGLTRTNMVFRYAIPEASEGALRETVIPAGTDISSLVTGGKVEGILYLEQVTGCSGTVIQASQDIEASEHADPMWQGLLQSGHF